MRKFRDLLLELLVGIPLFILIVPIIIIFLLFAYFQRKKFKKRYAGFLKANNGKNFFCYNNRRNSKKYIEENILPSLDNRIEIIYLNGRIIKSEYEAEFVSAALYGLNHYNKFPHLMKIRDGELIDKSVNNPFYGVLNMNKSKKELLNKINMFFELDVIKVLPSKT
ncbi:hypothetical protein [uncultured Croceitalea sp.]|uniref:hypothetical protein n=1 Tax=uncultured Croceitalea sp. TaxID=1798908 RepID=UPI00374E3021